MERRPAACESRVDTVDPHRCTREKSLVAEDAAILSRDRSVTLAEAIPPSADSSNEKHPPASAEDEDYWFENDMADYVNIVENLIMNPYTRIIELFFENKIFVRIVMFF